MRRESETTIKLIEILAPIIGSRDLIRNVEKAISKAKTKSVNLDFNDITFVSRSAAHALLRLKENFKRKIICNKEVNFVKANKDVGEMLRIVAANKALPKEKPTFNAEKVNIETFLEQSLKFSN